MKSVKMRPRYGDFSIFQDGGHRPIGFYFSKLKLLTVGRLKRAELRRRAKCGRNRSNRGRDMAIFRFFKMAAVDRHLGFVVCVRTIHEGHLVVFTAVQNLVAINAVVLIICMFFDFASLA